MATRKPQRVGAAPLSVQRPPRRATPRTKTPRAKTEEPAGAAPAGGVRLTGRGGILLVSAVSLISALLSHLVGAPLVSGVAFTAACVVAALLVRSTDLLSLTVSPPLAYFAAALIAEMALTLGQDGFSRAVAAVPGYGAGPGDRRLPRAARQRPRLQRRGQRPPPPLLAAGQGAPGAVAGGAAPSIL
ncbi:DUF6542 domain-containing protein [Streptomonospora algeriensis]|uniref:DUF6542 domain-containing protein n=1 Tax=Streptomonospora algeriensis TaxID=995084 RepID=A0ABW3BI99_9ACTN